MEEKMDAKFKGGWTDKAIYDIWTSQRLQMSQTLSTEVVMKVQAGVFPPT